MLQNECEFCVGFLFTAMFSKKNMLAASLMLYLDDVLDEEQVISIFSHLTRKNPPFPDHVVTSQGHLLQDLDQPWLQPQYLEEFARAIHQRGAALDNCWGFVDGTLRPICRPGEHQRVMYNGHKRVHGLKFQSVAAPNGMIANLFGPVGEHTCFYFSTKNA